MNKQQLIKKLGYVRYSDTDDERYNYYNKGIDTAISFAKKLAEPEKPVVPQFVADWLEVCKENLGFGLSSAMSHSTSAMKKQPNKVKGWFNLKDNQETFAKAWIYGYEVEKEKLYTVELPSPNDVLGGHFTLLRDTTGKVVIERHTCESWKKSEDNQLTEAEIKKDFAWAWQFAKEVEE